MTFPWKQNSLESHHCRAYLKFNGYLVYCNRLFHHQTISHLWHSRLCQHLGTTKVTINPAITLALSPNTRSIYVIVMFSQNNYHMKLAKEIVYKSKCGGGGYFFHKSHSDKFFSLVPHLVQKFSVQHGIWRFITMLTTAQNLSILWTTHIHSRPPHHSFFKTPQCFSVFSGTSSISSTKSRDTDFLYHVTASRGCLLSVHSLMGLCFYFLWSPKVVGQKSHSKDLQGHSRSNKKSFTGY